MKKLKFPSAQTILLLIAAFVMVLTWFVPAGQYDKLSYDSDNDQFVIQSVDSSYTMPANQSSLETLNIQVPVEKFTNGDIYKPVGIPGSYNTLEARPQGVGALMKAPIKGIIAAADIIFLVLIIGGRIGVMNLTGAFDAGVAWMGKVFAGREYLLIILITSLIAAGGTTFGLAEETMAFYPILIPIFLVAGYDALVAVACIFLGSSIGTMCSTVNPFSTIIASDASGINWTTGLESRLLMLALCLVVTIVYIIRYAQTIRRHPDKSIIADHKDDIAAMFMKRSDKTDLVFTNRLRLILAVFALSFIVMIIGVSALGWWFVEMTTVFFVASVIIGVIGRIKETVFLDAFVRGAGDLLGVAFIIGIARGVTILMEDGLISDTMLFYASSVSEGMHKSIFVNIMLFLYAGLSFFMPSSSGMAVLTMPIFSPLADTVDIGREIIVDCYQYGMGLFYIINPTGLILASLAIIKVGFDRWLRFIWPLVLMLTGLTVVFLTIMTMVKY